MNKIHLLQDGNLIVIWPHQVLNPTETKQAAMSTNIHIMVHKTTSIKAEKKVESRPRRRNLTNLPNWMTDMTNMMTVKEK